MLRDLLFRVRALLRRRTVESELDAELRLHLEHEAAKYERQGLEPAEARRRARLALGGGIEAVKDDCRDAWGTRWLDETGRDLRYAVRQLAANRGFTTVAILSLALGIGANTAIFQLLDAVRLTPLPVARPSELAQIRIAGGTAGIGRTIGRYDGLSRPMWDTIRRDHPAFTAVFAWSVEQIRIGGRRDMRTGGGLFASGELFDVLGIAAFRGRTFTVADEQAPCPSPVVMVSHGYWQRALGGRDLADIGPLVVNDRPRQVVGVTPPGFFGLVVGDAFDVALPMCAAGNPRLTPPDVFSLTVMGRLRPPMTIESANRQLETASPAFFAATAPPGYSADTVARFKRFQLTAVPASIGVSALRAEFDEPLWLLLGITGLVLLIACANLANLLLARASARERDVAVRLALGASRGRIVRQLLTESLLLAAAGGALGVWLAQILSRALVDAISTESAAVTLTTALDWRVLLFAAATAAATSVVFGVAPARRAMRSAPIDAMKSGGRGLAGSRDRTTLHRALVVAQVAISLVLLAGGLLFVRSFRNLTTFDPGMRQRGIAVVYFVFPDLDGPAERLEALLRQVIDEVRTSPGVIDAASTTNVPLTGGSWTLAVRVGEAEGSSKFTWVSPGYFRTMQIRQIEGRDVAWSDTAASRRVAIVNEMFVREFLGGGRALGRTLRTVAEPGYPAAEYEIIGVVADTKYNRLRGPSYPMAFAPAGQYPRLGAFGGLVIHGSLPAATIGANVERAILARHADSLAEHFDFEARIRDGMVRERLMAMLSGFFGALAALLTVIGLYGVIAYLVARRRSEIGIRLALGARPGQVIALVAGDAARLIAAGLVIGLALAVVAGRVAGSPSLLFGLQPNDSATLAAAGLLLALVAAAASLVPARRASRLDALAALRHE